MHKKLKQAAITVSAVSILAFLGSKAALADQILADKMGTQLNVHYTIIDNQAGAHGVDCAALGADWASCNKAVITLKNTGDSISGKNWAIYFHDIREVLAVDNDQFKITQLTGDLNRIEPTEKFTGFPAGASIEIPIVNSYWQVSVTDVMPRWYVVSENSAARVIKNTDTEDLLSFVTPLTAEQTQVNADDKNVLVTPVVRFERNKDIVTLQADQLRGQIVPTPLKVTLHDGDVDLGKRGIALTLPKSFSAGSLTVLKNRFAALNIKVASGGFPINAVVDAEKMPGKMPGSYQLTIDKAGAKIIAADDMGVFYGVQSILSLLSPKNKVIAMLDVEDAPRFEYRGTFLDIGRNFKTKGAVLRLLDQMAAYKLNKFHFHVSDDEGWRLEIPGLPELTEIGSQRCHDLTEQRCLLPQLGSGPTADNLGSGYLKRDDYVEIVKYAKDRFIEVLPEIDMPAHARAAVISMEARYNRLHQAGKEEEANEYRLFDPTDESVVTSVQFYHKHSFLNPCLPSSKRFVDKVISEVAQMHKDAGQPLQTWHFGGDEAKNIRYGAGYQDSNAAEKAPGKGLVDMSKQTHPWEKSQACNAMIKDGKVAGFEELPSYFALEVSEIIAKYNIPVMQAWQDGLKHAENAKAFKTDKVRVNFWDALYWGGASSANDWANKGYQVVISNPDYVYLDMPYEVNPLERGYYWASRSNDERKIFSFAPDNLPQNAETSKDRFNTPFAAKADTPWPGAYGISAQLWNETIRTDEQMEYMMYPRLLVYAERAWHRAAWELPYEAGREFKNGETNFVDADAIAQDWVRFVNVLSRRELSKLELANIPYRLPVPGAKVENGLLSANIIYPGLAIEYSLNGGEKWQTYQTPVTVNEGVGVLVRSKSLNGLRRSRAEAVQ